MDTSTGAATSEKPARYSGKIDKRKALDLLQRGVPAADVARQQGVSNSAISHFIKRHGDSVGLVKHFNAHRSDIFSRIQAKSLNIQEMLIDDLLRDGVLASLKPHEKSDLIKALNAQAGTLYDKQRLEDGKSTENHSILHRMMGSAFEQAHKPAIKQDNTQE